MLAAAAAGLAYPAAAAAAVYTVASTADGGSCEGMSCDSIRAALAIAHDGDVITIPAGDYALRQGPLNVTAGVAIVGAGAAATTIHPDGAFTVFTADTPQAGAAIAGLTISRGTSGNDGGDVRNTGNLALERVRVTGGSASDGGGIANLGGALTIVDSLLDANTATRNGGALYTESGAAVVIDMTITGNSALNGGGAAAGGDEQGAVDLERATVARNSAGYLAGGVYSDGDGGMSFARGSILAGNTASVRALRAAAAPSDCSGSVEDRGGNLETAGGCGFATVADPLLDSALEDLGGGTPVLALAPTSPAIDLAGACEGADQRGVPRPQGAACDAGAYELAAALSVDSAPPRVTRGTGVAFAFSSPGVTAFQCRLDGPAGSGAWFPCTSPRRYAGLAPSGYLFHVRLPGGTEAERAFAVQAAPVPVPTPSPTPLAIATPAPPRYHRNVVVRPIEGTVTIRLPGRRHFVTLTAAQNIPLGSGVDTRHGRIRLTAARTRAGKTQRADFYSGMFKIGQRGSYTELTLAGPQLSCGSRAAKAAIASAHHPKKRKHRTRRLWGSGRGHFRTRGRYSAATVRGTQWLVQDSCRGTLTRVVHGVVSVRDRARHRTILLRAGRRYLARRPRRRR